MLLSATSKAANAGTSWNENRTSLEDWGREPMLVEPVNGYLKLAGIKNAQKIKITLLNGQGQPIGKPYHAIKKDGIWQFRIGETVTLWYFLDVS